MKKAISLLLAIVMAFAVYVPVTASAEIITDVIYTPEPDFYESDELFAAYAEREFYPEYAISLWGTYARERLTPPQQGLYDKLKENIVAVASGESSNPQIYLSRAQLSSWGVQTTFSASSYTTDTALQYIMDNYLHDVIDALLADCPYDLYWFDKTTGWGVGGSFYSGSSYTVNYLMAYFTVVEAYQPADYNEKSPSTDAEKTGATTAAVANATAIKNKYASLGDNEKLTAYKDEICSLVSYNDAAADDDTTPYGDPWQLIYVFDNDTSTNVVCEGYSKAFQYLCDISSFNSVRIACYSVSGTTRSSSDGGGHMWNIVTMDDGKNYIADITNSDTGTIGNSGGLFLNGMSGSVNSGYSAFSGSLVYTYYSDTLSLWGSDSSSILNLSATDYVDTNHICAPVNSNYSTSTTHHWYSCDCGAMLNQAPHTGEWKTVTEEKLGVDGLKEYRCTECNYLIDSEPIPALHYTTASEWEKDANNHYKLCDCGCGKQFDVTAHTGEWETVTEEQLGVDGLKEYRCTECNYLIESEPIPALHYTTATEWEKDANNHYKLCDCGCGKQFDVTAHTGEWKTVTEEQLGVDGLKEYRCVDCNYLIESQPIPALHYTTATKWESNADNHYKLCDCGCGKQFDVTAHTGEWKTVTEEKLGVDGLKEYRCVDCNYLIDSEPIPALHYTTATKWENDENNHYKLCDCGCGKQFDVTAHTAGEWVTVKEAEIGIAGEKVQSCTQCNMLLAREEIPALENPDPNPDPDPDPDPDPNPTVLVGDINGNGKIDARDYLLLKRAYFGTYTLDCGLEIADINGNGKIDARDYLLLKRTYFGTYTIQ